MLKYLWKYNISIIVSIIFFSTIAFSQTDYWELAGTPSDFAINDLAFGPNGNLYVSIFSVLDGKFYAYKSIDEGTSWNRIDTNIGTAFKYRMAVSETTGTIVVAGADTVYRSTNEGSSWRPIPLNKYVSIVNLTSSPNGFFFAGTPVDGIMRSTDDGMTWENYYSGLTQFSIYSFAFKDSGITFCSSYMGAVYRSINNGESWMPISITGYYDDVLCLSAQSNGYLFAGTNGDGVFRSSNDGNSWIKINNGLLNTQIIALCLNSRQYLFAGTSNGVFRSIDYGEGWTEINEGLGNHNIQCLAISPDGKIFAGTGSGQVYRSIEPTTSIHKSLLKKINIFSLHQNYPNPFNPTTTINYSIPKASLVTLKVYDVLGREVATLVNEEKSAGNYKVNFDGISLSSGIYFYKMQAGGYSSIKKMILMK